MLTWIFVATAAFQQAAPANLICELVKTREQWVGFCGSLFGGAPTLAVAAVPAGTRGAWRSGPGPVAVWAGAMRFEGGGVPVEIEVYAEGTGVLRSGVNWAIVTRVSRRPDTLRVHLDVSRRVPASDLDRAIVRRAAEILSSESVWDRADDRNCGPDDRTWSVYCAMHRASLELTGGFDHRRPALQVVREIVSARSAGRQYSHRLQDYNNDPTTRLADVRSLFAEATVRMNAASLEAKLPEATRRR